MTSGSLPAVLDKAAIRTLDAEDDLAPYRAEFHHPRRKERGDGSPLVYLCGNSLGLQPRSARAIVDREMDAWARDAVDGHFKDDGPWLTYHELVRDQLAELVGAKPHEVVAMNTLTVNVHLLLVTFFRPDRARNKILIDWPIFPSDLFAVKTHLASRGLDPEEHLVIAKPSAETLSRDDITAIFDREGERIAVVLMAGVNYLTGQVMDMPWITREAHARGCVCGFDLAHAAGNVPLALHDWDVDFAAWCSYKYLNSGPGAVAGAYLHERHARNRDLPRYAGWWGNDPTTRFEMQAEEEFVARPDADGWQISNPPILSLAPLRASLALFHEVGMDRLRAKSVRLTGGLRRLIEERGPSWAEVITPAGSQGCQLSVRVTDDPRGRFRALEAAGVVGDFRDPDVIRLSPVPLYNTFEDVWHAVEAMGNRDQD